MASDPDNCAICDWRKNDVDIAMSADGRAEVFKCPRCGSYEIAKEMVSQNVKWAPQVLGPLSCAARQASDDGHPLRITSQDVSDIIRSHTNSRVADNQLRLLQVIGKKSVRPRNGATLSAGSDFTVIDCYSNDELVWYFASLVEQGLITKIQSGNPDHNVSLTVEGWKRIQPVPNSGGIPGRCFVAMWFSNETHAAYEDGIKPAIIEAGFTPIRIDQKEHNNEIPDEIIAEIRNAQFMVADFTGQRGGVYYEAGFAMGLGRKVIWCCREDYVKQLHFDTSHRNHIVWTDPQDLASRLYKRIRATILEQN